jgi:hypothetical protein
VAGADCTPMLSSGDCCGEGKADVAGGFRDWDEGGRLEAGKGVTVDCDILTEFSTNKLKVD